MRVRPGRGHGPFPDSLLHNLRLLRSARLVRYRKQGRNVYYALDDAHIRLLLDVGLQHLQHVEGGRG